MIGEDNEFVATASKLDSWWDDDEAEDTTTKDKPKVVIDATNVVTREVPDEEDNDLLPTLNTKVESDEDDNVATMQAILNVPPPVRCTIVDDDTTISSSLTIDAHMDNMENSVNFINHMLQKI